MTKLTIQQAVLIAAGESSRFWPLNHYHKSEIKILGRPLIYWTIKGLAQKGIRNIVVVHRPPYFREEELKAMVTPLRINLIFVVQKEPLGTGNAIWQAKNFLQPAPFFVFWPYKIFAGDIAEVIFKKYQQKHYSAILVGHKVGTPGDYGYLKYKDDQVIEVCEKPAPGQEPSDVRVMGCYFFEYDFFHYYEKVKGTRPEDFVDALNLYCREKKMGFVLWSDYSPRLKYPWEVLDFLKSLFNSSHFRNYISPNAQLGRNVVLEGEVYIADQVVIGDQTTILGPCYLGPNCQIGSHNLLRGPVNLEEGVVTGAFMEIKNSLVQKETHFHSGYLGDSVISENCRFGAGFIAANRRLDRQEIVTIVKNKKVNTALTCLGTMVGKNVRVGIHCGTMPGVLIGANSVIGPGILISKNLPDNSVLLKK